MSTNEVFMIPDNRGGQNSFDPTLPCHVFGKGCKGIIVVNFLGATAAAVTGVNISVGGSTRPLLSNAGNALTTLTTGFHIITFDKPNNRLNLIV